MQDLLGEKEEEQEALQAMQLNLLETELDKERQYPDVLCRKYILVYYVDLDRDWAKILKLDKHSNVWKMPEMRPVNF